MKNATQSLVQYEDAMSIQRTDPKKAARKKSEALAVKAPVPAPAPAPLSPKAKDRAILASDKCYAEIVNTLMGPVEAHKLLKLGFHHSSNRLLAQMCAALPGVKAGCQDVEALTSALEAVASLKPRDGLELMLCSQMVALHSQGLEYLRRTMFPDQTNDDIDHNVNRAARLLRTFALLTESLRAHRSGGKQTVTVEHVTVQAGGQAIVGTVNRGLGGGDAQQNGE